MSESQWFDPVVSGYHTVSIACISLWNPNPQRHHFCRVASFRKGLTKSLIYGYDSRSTKRSRKHENSPKSFIKTQMYLNTDFI